MADARVKPEGPVLGRQQWIAPKVRDNAVDEEREASHLPLQRPIAAVGPERAAVEVPLDVQQHLAAIAVLADRQTRAHLPPDQQGWPGRDRDREASLTVDKSRDVRRQIHSALQRARVLLRP